MTELLKKPTNDEIADVLDQIASLLEAQRAIPYRVSGYRAAADSLRHLAEPAADILSTRGRRGLDEIPKVGLRIASTIEEYVYRGRIALLDRLAGKVAPEDLFATIPGIGDELAHRAHAKLGIETLEDLERAAHDGSLARVPGFGPHRVEAVRRYLRAVLSHTARRRSRSVRAMGRDATPAPRAPVALLLAIDAEYRARARAGELRRIAPRRFNAKGDRWLPIMHAERDCWEVTAMYSNTARAHRLGKMKDWVVIVYARAGLERQCTVVTERSGELAGQRVVRGREVECAEPRMWRGGDTPAQLELPFDRDWGRGLAASVAW